jgi:P-type E1-E2 ATPase
LGNTAIMIDVGVDAGPLQEQADTLRSEGQGVMFVAIDGVLAAALVLEDRLRPDASHTVRRLRALGWGEVTLVTGDQRAVAETVGRDVGVDTVLAEQTPDAKVAAVRSARRRGVVGMVGDGINDAPALAAADVGIAMGARGATASSETADVVIVPDRLDLLVTACAVAQRSRRIALESIVAGMVLSGLGMVAAAAGFLPPIAGALAQEGIDLLVILNALRARLAPRASSPGA